MIQNLAIELQLERRIPVYYKYLHKRIVDRNGKRLNGIPLDQNTIARKDVCKFLYDFYIPKEIMNEFLKEMESYGLIKNGKRTIEIIGK